MYFLRVYLRFISVFVQSKLLQATFRFIILKNYVSLLCKNYESYYGDVLV
jgi:hypothetical protein